MELTKYQQIASDQLIEHFQNKQNVFLNAVCGAGKTEMVVPLIKQALKKNKRVCFATPRTALTIELSERLCSYIDETITLVYGGHCDNLEGNMVVCTTHQLQKFAKQFDLVILDEMDAFPFCGNDELKHHFIQSCKGVFVCMSATQNDFVLSLIKELDLQRVTLLARHHLQPIPVPRVVYWMPWHHQQLQKMIKQFNKGLIIFVATVAGAKKLQEKLDMFDTGVVYSSSPNFNEQLQRFRDKQLDCLICTTILERGVTFEGVHVLVYQADLEFFSQTMLIQMAGRAGRKQSHPTGEVIFFAKKVTQAMVETTRTIQQANRSLSYLS